MISDGPVALLNDFYQLTGNPVLLPKFGFYQGHLNAYNRDYWVEDEKGILFEDGKRYKESQKDNGGVKESLNGEKDNYQFSARAVIDRYKNYDMPLGWLLPNDGYGAGYGQTETLDGNIQNLKTLPIMPIKWSGNRPLDTIGSASEARSECTVATRHSERGSRCRRACT